MSFDGITLAFLTDTHFRTQNPEYRKDSFKESLLLKLQDVKTIIGRYQVDAVLHGGDVFDTPNVTANTWVELGAEIQSWDIDTYAIAGNHDMEGQNTITLPGTPIDQLRKLSIINLIIDNKDNPYIITKNGISVQITGRSFHAGMDHDECKEDDYVLKSKQADYAIHMVHGNLTDKPIFELADFTLLEEIKHTAADVTLSGHWHNGFPLTVINDDLGNPKYFYNPGGIVRKTKREMKRMPKIVLIFISKDGIRIEDIPLPSAKPTTEILNIEKLMQKEAKENNLQNLITSFKSKTVIQKTVSVRDMLNQIANQDNVDIAVREMALNYITLAKEQLG